MRWTVVVGAPSVVGRPHYWSSECFGCGAREGRSGVPCRGCPAWPCCPPGWSWEGSWPSSPPTPLGGRSSRPSFACDAQDWSRCRCLYKDLGERAYDFFSLVFWIKPTMRSPSVKAFDPCKFNLKAQTSCQRDTTINNVSNYTVWWVRWLFQETDYISHISYRHAWIWNFQDSQCYGCLCGKLSLQISQKLLTCLDCLLLIERKMEKQFFHQHQRSQRVSIY